LQFLSEEAKAFTKSLVDELRKRRDVLVPLVNQIYGFKTTAPPATFYLFVNVTEAMAATGSESVEQFRKFVHLHPQ
jgi:aspartate/methionine/tyrosine aminotransferase